MKITVLSENTACRPEIKAEHGLSLFIETELHNVLFDMGQTDIFYQNAQTLGIDLSRTDIAVLSHGHYDHGGGIQTFCNINGKAPVYASIKAFGDFYSTKYIGLPKDTKSNPRILPIEGKLEIASGVTLYESPPISCDETVRKGLYVKENECLLPDGFSHEIYLVIEEKGRRILFCGCSHRGAVEIARYFSPDIFIGGFHLKNLCPQKDRAYLTSTAESLLALPDTVYCTCHCTGSAQYAFMKEIMKNRLRYLRCGESIVI